VREGATGSGYVSSGTAGRKLSSIWPLPGGLPYTRALGTLLERASDRPTTAEFVAWIQAEFPRVTSPGVARGYRHVLGALGFVETRKGRVELTPAGRSYRSNPRIDAIRATLIGRIAAIDLILEELAHGSLMRAELGDLLTARGYTWDSDAPLRYRLEWLRSVELVQLNQGRYERIAQPLGPASRG
jgi:hypothetical protein